MMDIIQLYTMALANNKVRKTLFNSNPCWVWSKKADRVLWANEAGCRFFDTKSLPDLLGRTFRPVSPATVEIARTSNLLKKGENREIDLRFFRGINPITLPARLERIQLVNGQNAVFVRVLETPDDLKGGNPDKDKTRLMKLFSRGDEAVALLNDKGKLEAASQKFQEQTPEKAILKEALRKAEKEKSHFYSHPLKKGRLLSLCLVGKKGHDYDFVFASLSDKENNFVTPQSDDETKKDKQTDVSGQKEKSNAPIIIFSDKQETEAETRFTFAFDEKQTFTSISNEFSNTIGPETGNLAGENWLDLSARYNLDPQGFIAKKINQQAIWTETVHWPLCFDEDIHEKDNNQCLHVPITITAMPVFNSTREFEGFRGFGSINTKDVSMRPLPSFLLEADDHEEEIVSPIENKEHLSSTSKLDDMEEADITWQEDESDNAFEDVQLENHEPETLHQQNESVFHTQNIVPLHNRPVPVAPPMQNEAHDEPDLSALSKPEQDAFKQIAKALNARVEDIKTQKDESFDEALPEKMKATSKQSEEEPATEKKKQKTTEKLVFYDDKDFDAAEIVEGHKRQKPWPAKDLKSRILARKTINEHINQSNQPEMGQLESGRSERARKKLTDLLNRLPVGLIVSRDRSILFANKTVLNFLGYETEEELEKAGGINELFIADASQDPGSFVNRDFLKHLVIKADNQEGHLPQIVNVKKSDGTKTRINLRLQSGQWDGQQESEDALLMVITEHENMAAGYQGLKADMSLSQVLGQSTDIMDIASDGILIINETGRLLHANASAEALFNRNKEDILDTNLVSLFADESQKSVADYLDGLTANGVLSVLNDGREVIGKEINGGLIPLFITIGRLEKNDNLKGGAFCVVLRDITQWKRAEEELIESRRTAETANAQKSDFLATISHEIRTPLNAIIGFSEVMMSEHFGPMENTRYLEYAHDIHQSGKHLVSLVNDLLDLSKIEAGKLDMTFAAVDLNPVIQECVALMQPDANRDRIIIRTSLAEGLPAIVADIRSIRQIILNLLSNGVKFTKAGGQVIISTTIEENGEVALRVRDTGIGMSESDLDYAMQPFQQLEKNGDGQKTGTGLGLPLTKALAEANRADFSINSRVNYGTLIQLIFPNERVLAQ